MFFNWVRTKVRDAVLAGVNDAAEEIDRNDPGGVPTALASLRGRLQALPAPEVAVATEPARKARRGAE